MLDFCCACAADALLAQVQTVGSGYIQLPPQKRFEGVVVQPPTLAVSIGSCKHSSGRYSGQPIADCRQHCCAILIVVLL
jgi:hypothetical protein